MKVFTGAPAIYTVYYLYHDKHSLFFISESWWQHLSAIPAAYAREHGLTIGDVVIWNPDGSLKIMKRERFEKIAHEAAEFVSRRAGSR